MVGKGPQLPTSRAVYRHNYLCVLQAFMSVAKRNRGRRWQQSCTQACRYVPGICEWILPHTLNTNNAAPEITNCQLASHLSSGSSSTLHSITCLTTVTISARVRTTNIFVCEKLCVFFLNLQLSFLHMSLLGIHGISCICDIHSVILNGLD